MKANFFENYRIITKVSIIIFVFVLILLQAQAASLNSSGLLDNLINKFADTARNWEEKITFYASNLFWMLTLLSMIWTFGMLAIKNGNLSEALAEIIRFLATTGFFFWLLKNGPAISASIIKSMQKIAAEASGLGDSLSPSSVVDVGFDIVSKVAKQFSIWHPLDSAIGIISALIILIVLTLVGVNMLLLLISGWILIYAGVFLLGFGGGNWTSDIAINYYKTVIGIAVQLFAMILIVGIGKSFIDQYYAVLQNNTIDLGSLFVMVVVSIILLTLTNKVPPMIASVIGSGGSTMGIGTLGASSAMTGAAVAASAAVKAGSMVAGGLTSLAGGASALKAAFQQAQQHMSQGSGTFSGSRPPSNKGGSQGFMNAMGTAGRFAADMGTNLAKGAAAVAKDKAENVKNSTKQSIGQTVGGKIASQIKDSMSNQAHQNHLTNSSIETNENVGQQTQQSKTEGLQTSTEINQDKFTGDSLGAGKKDN